MAIVLVLLGLLIWLSISEAKSNGSSSPVKMSGRRLNVRQKRSRRSNPAPRKSNLTQSRNSCVSRGSRDFTMPNSAADVGFIPRPPDQAHFNKLNPNKFYGASNAVPHPNAGYEMTNCAYKNLTVQDDKDPILAVADLLPSQTLNKQFIENTDLTTFPVGNAFPSLARSAYMNCIQVDRSQISERSGLQRRIGPMDLLRNWGQVYLARGAQTTAAAKADVINPDLMFNATGDFLSFAELGETTPAVPQK